MGFLRTAVTLVAAGIATNMILKARRDGMANRQGVGWGSGRNGPGIDRSGADGSGTETDRGLSSVSGVVGGTGSASTGAGADSPNDGERVQRQGLASTAAGGDPDNLFGSRSQDGSTPRTPGLSDYSRGA
jgi:hypothetical protein